MSAPGAGERIDVVVPARDEQDHIVPCVEALLTARDVLRTERPGVDCGIVVVLDHCTDATPGRLADALDGHEDAHVLRVDSRSVGAARAEGVTHALTLPGPPVRSRWVANTDADSRVQDGWLVQQVDAMRQGTEVLIGAVVPEPTDLTPEVFARWRTTHPTGGALGHVHGANLGIRADVYLDLGGFSRVPEHEDAMLVERARSAGVRVDATVALPVVTSGRFIGRTPGGYADHLATTYGTAQA